MSHADHPQWPSGGGEMGQRIRLCDWSETPLGDSSRWPQSIRTTLEVLLNLPRPALLLWREGLFLFPNDRYSQLLGGLHNGILGKALEESLPEARDLHGPHCGVVRRHGQALTVKDRCLVLGSDNHPEERVFTLTYSPVPDPSGEPAVLVVLDETTEQVRARALEAEYCKLSEKYRYERTRLLEDVFRLAPSFLYVLRGPESIFEFANPAFYQLVGQRTLMGRPIADALPEAAASGLQAHITEVLASGEPYVGHELPLQLARSPGMPPEERYIDLVYQPLLDSDGVCRRVLGHGVDVTDQVLEQRRTEAALKASWERFQRLAAALAAIAASRDRDEVMEVVRTSVRQLTGADGASLVLRDGEQFHYASEDCPRGSLWDGQDLATLGCVSRWAIEENETVIVEDVHQDSRIPPQFHKPDLVRSLIIVPLGSDHPFAVVGAYWSQLHRPDNEEVAVLKVLTRAAWDVLERRQTEDQLRLSEERMAAIFARAPVGLCELSLKGQFLRVNDELCRILGRTADQIEQLTVPDLTFEEDREHSMRALEQLLATGEPVTLDKRYIRPDGSRVWASSSLTRLDDSRGRPNRVLAVTVDLTKRVQAEQALRASEERYRSLADLSPDGILVYAEGRIYYANTAAARVLGADTVESLIGRSPLDFVEPDMRELVRHRIDRQLEHNLPGALVDERWRRMDGATIEMEVSAARIELEGRPALQVLLRDITDRKLAEMRIWQHANFCPLTRLPNRRLFRDRLEQEVKKAHRSGNGIGLLFIDLDEFKQVNDLLGHDAGDQLLVEAAQRLEGCVRAADTVARLGGDEFTVIISELDDPGVVEKISQKIVEALGQSFHLGTEVVYVSASVGITLYPEDATSASELVRKADQAMYAAKAAGKNQFSYFTQAMDEQAHHRLRLASELRNALREGQLEVYYQPVVDLAQGHINKAEALVRWHHPTFGLVEPSQFIPLAEESGLIIDIGNWVFQEAATCSKRWSDRFGFPFQVSVNKSPMQFLALTRDDDWLAFLRGLGLSGSGISVEITEGVLLHASKTVTDQLLKYRDAGIQVAIDDFGTGYSSMAYLKKFDIDYLKIDRSFVSDMPEDGANRTIAESIIVMAHKLGLKVIAEGIENEEQKSILSDAGCDYGQGFLFAHPLPATDFEKMVERTRSVPGGSTTA